MSLVKRMPIPNKCDPLNTWEQDTQATMTPFFDVTEADLDVCPGNGSVWRPDFRTPQEVVCTTDQSLTDERNSQLNFYINTSEMPMRAPQEVKETGQTKTWERANQYQGDLRAQGDARLDEENPWARYNAVPSSQRPSVPGWNNAAGNHGWESTEVALGPVYQRYFSDINVRQIGDYLERAGLGRPSGRELFDSMRRVYTEQQDFVDFGPIRTIDDVKMQLMRLNSLFLQDVVPKMKIDKWSWERYQADQQFGYGPSLIDRPDNGGNSSRQYTEFAQRW